MAQALREAYQAGEDDETLEPRVLVDRQGKPIGRFRDGDYVIFYNIRGEREVELCHSLLDRDFPHFQVEKDLNFRKESIMPRILMIQGSNMNLLGVRQPEIYGTTTASELDKMMNDYAKAKGFDLEIFYTNSEGECIDRIIKAHYDKVDVLVMNPGGFTYAAYSIRDTIKGVKIPYIEIHLSNHYDRGIHSVIAPAANGVIMGLGIQVYFQGLDAALYLAGKKR